MAAIVGFVSLDGRPVAPTTVPSMLATLAHRGAEAVETWHTGSAALGAGFDVFAPESAHAKPIATSPDGRYVVAADVRLDDRERLTRTLGVAPTMPDADLIAHALSHWGRDAPQHLTGDFAFAAWDKASQTLFCARDRMGVRPLYYAYLPGKWLALASEQRALVDLTGFDKKLNPLFVADYLLVTLDHTSTLYQNVYRLPAATSMSVRVEGIVHHPTYWSLDPEAELRLSSDAAYAEAFHQVFEQSVRDRMRSVHPIGAALSGGLDSSAIAVVARNLQAAPLPVFSGQFPGVPERVQSLIDERPYVHAVVDTGGFDLYALDIDKSGPFDEYARVSHHLEDAFRTINLYMHWQMFGAARSAGVRVFLDGLDGDTAVSHGLDRLYDLVRARSWDDFASEVMGLGSTPQRQRGLAWHYAVPVLARDVRAGRLGRVVEGMQQLRAAFGVSRSRLVRTLVRSVGRDALVRRHRDDALRAAFLRPEAARQTGAWERHLAFERATQGLMPTERAAHIRDLRSPLCPLMLEMEDRAAAAFGIEPRYPFFDHRLMEFCVSLPSNQKLRQGQTRYILRTGLKGVLPEAVRLRTTKANLKPAFDLALARVAQKEIAPYLFETPPAVAPFVDMDALRTAYDAFVADPLAHSTAGTQIYAIAALERGLRRLGLA